MQNSVNPFLEWCILKLEVWHDDLMFLFLTVRNKSLLPRHCRHCRRQPSFETPNCNSQNFLVIEIQAMPSRDFSRFYPNFSRNNKDQTEKFSFWSDGDIRTVYFFICSKTFPDRSTNIYEKTYQIHWIFYVVLYFS